jgi:uncharacterized membrane protein YraQ (UPF0718 family)
MAKIGLVVFVLVVGLLIGGILQEHVCDTYKNEELGTGKSFVGLTCSILSIPLDLLLLFVAIIGAIVFYIKTREK